MDLHLMDAAPTEAERSAVDGFLGLQETGWEGEIVALLRINSLPNRRHEDRQNVAFDFLVTPIREVGEPDDESSAIAWVPIGDLPPLDTLAFDHGDSVAWYLQHRHVGFPPPVVL